MNPITEQKYINKIRELEKRVEKLENNHSDSFPEREKGEWIDNQTRKDLCNCSKCFALSKVYSKFCPNCGADMREGKE